jgi:UDP-2,3-diacylglucosamine hydrolase
MPSPKAVYISSDHHFGVPNLAASQERERLFIKWLEECKVDAQEIILLGDLFDFWFEYGHVVPKGTVRVLGKLAELADSGIPITLFCGNHDMWQRQYLSNELGIRLVRDEQTREFFGKSYYLHHGDGKGPGDRGYKLMKWGFRSRLLRFCFRWLHPDIGVSVALASSKTSRHAHAKADDIDKGPREYLVQYVKQKAEQGTPFDYFVFGHRHFARQQSFGKAQLLVLGDWISDFSYLRITESDGPQFYTYQNGKPELDRSVIRVGVGGTAGVAGAAIG